MTTFYILKVSEKETVPLTSILNAEKKKSIETNDPPNEGPITQSIKKEVENFVSNNPNPAFREKISSANLTNTNNEKVNDSG